MAEAEEEYLPALQSSQTSSPVVDAIFPGTQSSQLNEGATSDHVFAVPRGQRSQEADPGEAENFPDSQ